MEKTNIRKQIIPISAGKRSGRKITPTTLTIHSTDNPSSTAQNERDWLTNPDNHRAASWHICVDEKQAVMAIPLNERALHAGNQRGNDTSISLEICESGNREKTLQNAAEVTAQLLRERGWGVDKLRQHHDWSGKNCPRILRDTGKWGWFVEEVKQELLNEKESEDEEMKVYKYVAEMPKWARDTFTRLVQAGYVAKDAKGEISVQECSVQPMVYLDRLLGGKIEKLPEMVKKMM